MPINTVHCQAMRSALQCMKFCPLIHEEDGTFLGSPDVHLLCTHSWKLSDFREGKYLVLEELPSR